MADSEEKKDDKDPAQKILEIIKGYYKGISKREEEGMGAD